MFPLHPPKARLHWHDIDGAVAAAIAEDLVDLGLASQIEEVHMTLQPRTPVFWRLPVIKDHDDATYP